VQVPRYVRLNRVIRDFPTTNVVAGNKKANLRQIALQRMADRGLSCQCIRCREVRRRLTGRWNIFWAMRRRTAV
jgi:elongator complex protein 3